MAIGNYYPVSGTVVDQDLFLGTKAGNNNTVNYTAQTVANYLNTNSKIAIGGQISFRFDISPNIPKTISFSGGGGSGTPFASITQLIVSGIDLSSTDITIFLNYLNGSEILLAQQNQPNLFGNYKITGYTQIGTSNFYTLDLQFIGGNGTITENTYYNISSFVLSSGIDVPTLNQVLTAGNTSIIDAKVGNLYSYDNLNADYGIVQFYDGGVSLKAATTNNLLFYNDATGSVSFSNGTYLPTLNFAGVGNNVYTFQNANGTLAFLSDIPSLSGYVPTSRTLTINGTSYDLTANRSWSVGTVTSVGLSMPSAFNVSSSPVTGSGTIAVTGAGVASQYIRGDGTLANFPTSTGGGASVSYYLNGSISQGTIGGVAYKEMNSVPVIGAGTDFTINADGYIAQFITDVGDPNKLLIPGGNWNFETYFSASSGGGTPRFYIELYKYDGTTFTLIASNSASPRLITDGTNIEAYFSALAVPATTLLVTDRLAVRFYVIHSGRTITMHTENSHLCQVITTFSSGLTALNGLTSQVQYFAVGTSGTDFNISSVTDTHTFNLPTASAVNRGALSSADWTAFNSKASASGTTNYVAKFTGATAIGNSQIFDNGTNVGIGTTSPTTKLQVSGDANGILSLGRFENTNVGNAVQSRIQVVSGTATAQIQMFGSGHSTTPRLFRLSGSSDGGDMYLATGGVDRLAITLAGNVGIGTTAPVVKLAVAGTTTDTLRIGQTENLTGNKYMVLGMNVASQYAQIEATRYGETYLPVVINPSGGNVGIGTTTPVARLHVAAQGALSTDIALRVRNSANTADLFNVNGNGNVGIGTTSPASLLDVQSAAAAVGTTLKVSNTNTGGGNLLQLDRATLSRVNGITFSTAGVEDWSLGVLRNGGSPTQVFSLSYQSGTNINSTGFAVTSTGNVGIGTISPSVKLHTVGDGLFSSNTNTNLTINSNGGVSMLTLITAAGAQSIYGGVGGLNNMDFYTASGFRMRIDPTGNVGIGTSTPQGRLDVRAPGALTIDTAFRVRNSADSNNLIIINGAGGIGVGTSSPLPSAVLDINSTTQGFLPPRMTNAQRLAISLPAVGLMVYCTDATEGLYIYKSTGWTFII
jgi:hypothetical protein